MFIQAALVFLQIILHYTSHLSTANSYFFAISISPVFGFCECANIKRVPGYKETDVQLADNRPDNRVSIPALNICKILVIF